MKNILNHKTRLATKVSVLAILLLFSIALPLLVLPASAATATVSISPTSGPNGTFVSVTGTGFLATDGTESAANTPIVVAIDGLNSKAITFGAPLTSANYLKVSSTGALSGWFEIGGAAGLNLSPGVHSVQISDSIASPVAVSFTITSPTVTLTPSTGPAGTSVLVSGSGFAKSASGVGVPTLSNGLFAASFAGTAITVAGAPYTSTSTGVATTMSSNVISSGSYSGTVSLPMITSGSAFTLTDLFGNIATATFALNTPIVTLSPVSGPSGTIVWATATGFGPQAVFNNANPTNPVKFGTTANGLTIPSTVTHQGTSVFAFTVGAGSTDYTVGAHTVTVTDSLGNAATASFTITPKATVTLGSAAVNSGTTYAPSGATTAMYVTASGFAANTKLTVTGSAGIPAAWLVFTAASITTNANGAITIAAVSNTAAAPGAGIYSITVSDGVNQQTVIITIASTVSFFFLSPNTGAPGTQVSIWAYDAVGGTPVTAATFDGSGLAVTAGATAIWPATPAAATFSAPTSGAGIHIVAVTAPALGQASYTTTSGASISIVSPSSDGAGSIITIVGSGYENVPGNPALTFSVDGTSVPATSTFTMGWLFATFAVPNFLPGSHTIFASDPAGNLATASFSLVIPTITVTPSTGKVGTAVAVTGSGFHSGEAITVTFDGAAMVPAVAPVGLTVINPNGQILLYTGTVTTGFTIPTSNLAAGAHTITVAGTTPGNAATFTFTVTPSVTLTPSAVRAGAYSTATGNGFAAASTLTAALNGTSTTWFNPTTSANTTTVTTDGTGNIPVNAAIVAPIGTASGTLITVITDASGNAFSVNMTILSAPAITLNGTQTVAGSPAATTVAGLGFSQGFPVPTARAATALLYSGNTLVSGALTLVNPTVVVSGTGTFASTLESFTVASGTAAGTYTVVFSLGLLAGPPAVPIETANATLVIIGTPTVTITPTTAQVGTNVSITIIGLAPAGSGSPAVYPITTATIGATSILTALNSINVPVGGAFAYNLTTTFLVPAGILGGTYTLTVGDGTRSATTTIVIAGAITLAPTTALKGGSVTITGTGFATAGTTYNVTFNGALVTASAGTTLAGGTISQSLTVPVTATSSNTIVVTDTSGDTASATLALATPTIMLTPNNGTTGSTVQIIGSGYTATSSVVVLIGGTVVNTSPAPLQTVAGTFIAYATIPAGLSGNVTISAIDASNNVGTAVFTVITGGATGFSVNQAALSSTAQTLNSAGTPATSFPRGSTAKISFVLDTTSGTGNVVWRITLQQGTAVYNIATTTASISTSPTTLTYTQLIPTGISAGTWTASVQIFASDGVTPLGVATLVFSVT